MGNGIKNKDHIKNDSYGHVIYDNLHKSIERFAVGDFKDMKAGMGIEHIVDLRPDFLYMKYEKCKNGHKLYLQHALNYSTTDLFMSNMNRIRTSYFNIAKDTCVVVEFDNDLKVIKYKTHNMKSTSHLRKTLRMFSVFLEENLTCLWTSI